MCLLYLVGFFAVFGLLVLFAGVVVIAAAAAAVLAVVLLILHLVGRVAKKR